MSVFRTSKCTCLLLLLLEVAAQILPFAGAAEAVSRSVCQPLAGRHRIELGLGLLSKISSATETRNGHSRTRSEADGLIGSISYTYWLEDQVSFNITTGVMDVDATSTDRGSDTYMEALTVMPLLFGVKYQLSRQPIGNALRPYASASIGPYFGIISQDRSADDSVVRYYSEAVLGARIGAGVDFFPSKHFALGIGAGYHFVSDYSERIGAKENCSGPDFSLSFGVVFGRGRY